MKTPYQFSKQVADLQAEVGRLTRAWQAMQLAKGKAEASEKEVWNERETLRAQLAAAQGQLNRPKPKCLACKCWSIDKNGNCDYCGAPYTEAAPQPKDMK